VPATKDPGAVASLQRDYASLRHDPRSFAHPEHRRFVFFEKLDDPFFLRLAHVP
jgi:hypothetical protein